MEKDLKWIKKHYGEQMMHLCRGFFPKILEKEGALPNLLSEHFAQDRNLANEIIKQRKENEFKDYIYSFIDFDNGEKVAKNESAVNLMRKVGYTLYPECKSDSDIQAFRKYWEVKEELCTFYTDRLNSCRVWFAVKDNASELKREDFKNPRRQDEYGTSVISIQFSKGENQYLSIKNRYNHTVINPDNTFNSNLENIIAGLSDAFERDYGVKETTKTNKNDFELYNYVCVNGKFYHYNYEINNKYYCDNGVIIDNFEVKQLPSHQMLMDYFIVDQKNHTIKLYDKWVNDSFLNSIGKIQKISFKNNILEICIEDGENIEIELDSKHQIISYKDENIQKCGNDFLRNIKNLKHLDLPNLKECGNNFLYGNYYLEELNLPNLKECGDHFLFLNYKLSDINLPNLEKCGVSFLYNLNIETLSLPKLMVCGLEFNNQNEILKELNLPSLEKCGGCFLEKNHEIESVNLPNLKQCGDDFFKYAYKIKEINLPNLKKCGNNFLLGNLELEKLNLPNLEDCGDYFVNFNRKIRELSVPKLKSCKSNFLSNNLSVEKLEIPEDLVENSSINKLIQIEQNNKIDELSK